MVATKSIVMIQCITMKTPAAFVRLITFIFLFFTTISYSYAQNSLATPPPCFGWDGKPMNLMNAQVMDMKRTLPNLQKREVYVKVKLSKFDGVVATEFGPHLHFDVTLEDGNGNSTQIGISHSYDEYTAPTVFDLQSGPILLCGEFSNTDINREPKVIKFTPSPTGAMIHWTHQANSAPIDTFSHGHPSGWIFANGKLFGQSK